MAQMDNSGLRTLLGMQSSSNLTGQDPYMAKRRAGILSGEEDMVPGADSADTRITQHQLGQAGLGVSRDSIRDDKLAQVRQALGMEQMKHQMLMQQGQQRGEYELAAADATSQARTQQEMLRNFLLMGRQNVQADRQDARQDDAQEARAALAGQKVTQGGVPTGDMVNRLSKSRGAYQGGWGNSLREMFGMERSGRQDYESALTDVLQRQGTLAGLQANIKAAQQEGMTGSQAIAEAEAQGAQLSPYEVEYIKLILGE